MKRRDFVKTSLTAAVATGFAAPLGLPGADLKNSATREFYEWRAYRLAAGGDRSLLDDYVEKALFPALNRLGSEKIGAFTEIGGNSTDTSLLLLIPYRSLADFAASPSRLNADAQHQMQGETYLQTKKDHPGFARIDSWLLHAFAGMPKMDLPGYAKERKPRIFEVRTYESYSESKGQKKVDMFNDGEIDVMREVELGPIFFGQALVGSNLPHLTYMLSGEDREVHKKHWGAFGKHPGWKKMSSDPKYADTVSKITNKFLEPTRYSQI